MFCWSEARGFGSVCNGKYCSKNWMRVYCSLCLVCFVDSFLMSIFLSGELQGLASSWQSSRVTSKIWQVVSKEYSIHFFKDMTSFSRAIWFDQNVLSSCSLCWRGQICTLASGDDGSALFPPRYIQVREMTGDVKNTRDLSVKGTLDFQRLFDFVANCLAPPLSLASGLRNFTRSNKVSILKLLCICWFCVQT